MPFSLLDCILGPALYRIFDENRSRDYVPYTLERYTDYVIRTITLAKTFCTTLGTPYLVYRLYSHYLSPSADLGGRSLVGALTHSYAFKLASTMTVAYLLASAIRGVLRHRNPAYREFVHHYKTASGLVVDDNRNQNKKNDDAQRQLVEAKRKLRLGYDYEFSTWPVDFHWSEGLYRDRVPTLLPVEESGGLPPNDGPVMRAVSWLVAHSIGRIMLYPGSLTLLQKVLDSALVTGRQFLIENYHASRYKLEARDGNRIDCIFADKRNAEKGADFKGNTLVICAEGNAGFYEIGVFTSPLNANYSVLGWNHPGFGGSTGAPYPQNEINAFDTVINFATTKLGFDLDQIYIFAWSIGGFPAAWASSQYPELKGMIVDASFDDVLPLARARMMPFLLPIVDSTIRNYFNLNISAYLNRYKGPVLLIRRLQDEIIPINPADPVRTNQGNQILVKLLQARFPKLIGNYEVYRQVEAFLHAENPAPLYRELDQDACLAQLVSYITANNVTEYPVAIDADDIGIEQAKDIALFMCFKLLKNFNSTHCTPLPTSHFEEPFDLFALTK